MTRCNKVKSEAEALFIFQFRFCHVAKITVQTSDAMYTLKLEIVLLQKIRKMLKKSFSWSEYMKNVFF